MEGFPGHGPINTEPPPPPPTSNVAWGVNVPIPTFLLESTTNPVPPTVRSEENRLVLDAVVLKKLVEVALVEVEFEAVKFCKVEEPMTRRSPDELMVVVAVPPMEREFAVRRLAKKLVEVALVVVERVMLLKTWAPVQVKPSDWSTEKAPEEMAIPLPAVA